VVKILKKQKQTNSKNILSIILLLSKNKNRDVLVFKSKQYLSETDNFSSQNYIIVTQKHTKIDNSTHKLHSLHSFI